jgi:hypothetical protein
MASSTPTAVRVSADPDAPAQATAPEQRAPHDFDFNGLPVDELLRLRGEIEQRLPALALKDLDLEKELVLQFLASQRLQAKVLTQADTPANQKAQVANALASSLAALAKFQTEVHSSERMKRIEIALIDAINLLPNEAKEAFLTAYAAILETL